MATTHVTLSERLRIEGMLAQGSGFSQIGKELGKARSTISREVRRNAIERRIGNYNYSFNECRLRTACPAQENCDKAGCRRRDCRGCRKGCSARMCPHYERETCSKLQAVPYVCNACRVRNRCTLMKVFYEATAAHETYRKELSRSRTGVAITKAEALAIQDVIQPLVEQGQSLYSINQKNASVIMRSTKTLYTYVNAGVFPEIKNIDLPRKVIYKGRRKKTDHSYKVDRACRVGRTKEDYDAFMASHAELSPVQMDTVEGPRAERRCLLTVQFTCCSLQMAFLREANDAASVSAVFRDLHSLLGDEGFSLLMPVILTDNGPEFSCPEKIERTETGKRVSRVFYCHPLASWEKAACENNHALIRRILPKGHSLASLTQQKVRLMMNHINAYPRAQYHGKSAYEMFVFMYGEALAQKLGLEMVPAPDITLKPYLTN